MELKNIILMTAMAGLSLSFGSTTANAAYSGNIARSVCASGSMVPRVADKAFWDNSVNTTCYSSVIDGGSATNFHWARFSIPVERASTTTTLTPRVRTVGGASGTGQVCATLYVSDPSGNLSGFTGSACTHPAYGAETLTPAAVTLPVDGAALFDIAAQNSGQVNVLTLSWQANGT